MASSSRRPPQRARRNVYPQDVIDRVPSYQDLIESQLMKYDLDLMSLPYAIGHTAKTTLRNRVKSGNLSLNDMLWIADYCDLDWNSVINALKIKRELRPVPMLSNDGLTVIEDTPQERLPEPPKPKVNKSSPKAQRFANLLLNSADDTTD